MQNSLPLHSLLAVLRGQSAFDTLLRASLQARLQLAICLMATICVLCRCCWSVLLPCAGGTRRTAALLLRGLPALPEACSSPYGCSLRRLPAVTEQQQAYLKAHDARQVRLRVSVVQDGELQVVVEENLPVILHTHTQLAAALHGAAHCLLVHFVAQLLAVQVLSCCQGTTGSLPLQNLP